MIQDDLENLNFISLSDVEKLEFNLKLLENYNRVVQQLMVGRNYNMAAIMSIALSLQTLNVSRLDMLADYAKLLYKTLLQDHQINAAAQAVLQEQADAAKQTTKETTKTTDAEGIINVDGKPN
jgi:hypothetical protein